MSLEFPPDDPWVAQPADRASSLAFLGGAEKGWDVHRRYAEVTTAGEVVDYLAAVSAGVAA
jgi:hypothetical protein